MSFTNNAEVIGSSDNTFHTVATGYEASVHALLIDNPSGSPETITIKIKNNVSGTTVNSMVIAVAANSSYTYPRPINLAQQDELILVSTGTAACGTTSIYTQLMSGVPSAITLSAKGAWASGTTYSALDIVSYSGGSWIALRESVGVTPVAGADWAINASQGAAGTLSHVVDDTTPQLGGNLDANGKTFDTSSYRQIADASIASGTHTFAYASGDMQQLTATGSCTIAFSGMPTGKAAAFIVDAINWGAHTITLPSGMLFDAATAPTFTAAGTDKLAILKDKDEVFSMFIIGQAIA